MKKKLYISQIGSWTHNPLPTHFSCVVFSHHLASIKFFFTVIPGSPHVIWSWPRPSLSLPNPSLGGMFSTLTLLIERPHYAKQEIRKKNKDKGLCHKYLLLVADSGLTYIQCAYLRIFKKNFCYRSTLRLSSQWFGTVVTPDVLFATALFLGSWVGAEGYHRRTTV